ncbi:PDGLE domain-containing protein [Nocardia sp. NPDC058176]|uniref:PDGLE domain-containing protein n=1 Tax=Nocardia sp. NPDC058176 TaxID=3346368 RepID=UPI0036D78415
MLRAASARTETSSLRARVSVPGFLLAFAAAAVLVAGALSYVASSHPDGLDATTQRGCTTVEVDSVEELRGECIAQNAAEHRLADSPLADYAIGGDEAWVGLAGVLGVAVAFAVLFTVVRAIGRRSSTADDVVAGSDPGPR